MNLIKYFKSNYILADNNLGNQVSWLLWHFAGTSTTVIYFKFHSYWNTKHQTWIVGSCGPIYKQPQWNLWNCHTYYSSGMYNAFHCSWSVSRGSISQTCQLRKCNYLQMVAVACLHIICCNTWLKSIIGTVISSKNVRINFAMMSE